MPCEMEYPCRKRHGFTNNSRSCFFVKPPRLRGGLFHLSVLGTRYFFYIVQANAESASGGIRDTG